MSPHNAVARVDPHAVADEEKYPGNDDWMEAHDTEPIDPVAERKLLWKLDALIVPFTAMLYISATLDRSNMGNAKLQGLLDIFGDGADRKFSIGLMTFYAVYTVLNVPGNIVSSILPPQRVLGVGAFIWSAASAAQAGAHNFGSIVACRVFIAVGEACFGASVPLYYALWYRRNEISVRIALYAGAGSLAGAFGGLIAYGVSFIKSHIATWRILFLIEGLPGLLLAVLIFFCLPGIPETSKFLNPAERELVRRRLADTGVSTKHTFDKSAFRAVFGTHTTYLNCVIYLSLNLALGSVSGFLPTIIKSLGYSNSRAQLFTVPPYAFAFVGTVACAYLSDKLRMRGPFVVLLNALSAVGFAILIGVPHMQGPRYFATFLVVLGAFGLLPIMLSWASNTAGSHSAAAIRLGFMNACGQCFSILASFMFPAKEGPRWLKGMGLNLGFNILAIFVAIYLSFYYARQNRLRDAAEAAGDVAEIPTEIKGNVEVPVNLHHRAPGFRFYI